MMAAWVMSDFEYLFKYLGAGALGPLDAAAVQSEYVSARPLADRGTPEGAAPTARASPPHP